MEDEASTVDESKGRRRPGIFRYSAAIFLGTIILWFVSEPYLEDVPLGDVVRPASFTLLLVAAALAIGERKKILIWAALVSTSAVVMLWIRHFRPDLLRQEYLFLTVLLFALYVSIRFSLTTQATLGYGDIVPRSHTARLLAVAQAVGGMFFVTILIARLVSVYSSRRGTEGP